MIDFLVAVSFMLVSPEADCRMVASLDLVRSWAWQSGDAALLRVVYTPDSELAQADVAAMRQWQSRGADITDLRSTLHTCHVVDRRHETVRIEVLEELSGSVSSADRTHRLPSGAPRQRTITLTFHAGLWHIDHVSAGQ